MSLVTLPNLGPDPFTVNASVLNGKVDPLATDYNGNIQNVNIAAGAGIVYSKLSLTDSVVNADINSSAAIASSKLDLSAVAQTIVMSSKAINMAKGSDIASATTTDIGAAVGNYVDVTGTTTITGLGTVQAGTQRVVRFTGALTLTHNGTSLLLPSAANITTAANDVAGFVSLGSGNWKCLWYQRYDGTAITGFTASTAPAGTVLQVVNTETGAVSTGTTAVPNDDSIPQSGEGDEYMTLAVTPSNASNKLKIDVVWCGSSDQVAPLTVSLFQDATAGALATAVMDCIGTRMYTITFTHYMVAGTTSATTFKVRAGTSSGATTTFNGQAGARKFGGVMASSITITEIKA